MITNAEIRSIFYDYFAARGHRKVLSAPLVPAKDPTLLFTNAGMNQFKNVFLQLEKRDYSRAVSIQKCMRVSGKHNDFDEVGKTDFHHTFFEMLGNFSFGDYFKEEAVAFAWELLTGHYHLSPEKLWITVFREDDEAFRIWEEKIGVPREKIVRLDEKDNFWQMGDTGPCGPCSEIHYDRGPQYGPAEFRDGNRRYVEIWNLVFMQYSRDQAGVLHPLPAPSIDTGMGMERLAAVLQNAVGNYGSDLFQPLIRFIAERAGVDPAAPQWQVPFKVLADHCRALTFLIADGVIPANEGRGYVLRRILRRAVKHGKALNFPGTFLHTFIPRVVELMKPFYPELEQSSGFIAKVVEAEEERFHRTIESGLKLFDEIVQETRNAGRQVISGADLFKLSDTYGFPVDFARDLAMENDLGVDIDGYRRELEGQRERSRLNLAEKRRDAVQLPGIESCTTEFTGYDELESEAEITALYVDNQAVESVAAKSKALLVLDRTPFYAESGGQVGDTGSGKTDHAFFTVADTRKHRNGAILHTVVVENGELRRGDRVRVTVQAARRADIAVHHTATHLLHTALREVLGLHVKQAGSYVGPDKLRFDFTHFIGLGADELTRIETIVNEQVRENRPAHKHIMSYDAALQAGAIAIFEEKYGDTVRMVEVEEFSRELCGGTHLDATGSIGLFKIVAETSISSGIRRIEAVAGAPALALVQKHSGLLHRIAVHFNQKPETVLDHLLHLETTLKEKEKQLKKAQSGGGAAKLEDLDQRAQTIGTLPVLVEPSPVGDRKEISELADRLKNRLQGVVVLFANQEEKSVIVAAVHESRRAVVQADAVVRAVSALVGGRGGGRPDFAQGGGANIPDAARFREQVMEILRQYA